MLKQLQEKLEQLQKPDFKKYEKIQDERLSREFANKLIELFYEPKLEKDDVIDAIKRVLEKIEVDDQQFAELVRNVLKKEYSEINKKYNFA